MITLGSDTMSPPGGWKLTVPETGVTIHAPYANALWKKVNAHLTANGHNSMDKAAFGDACCRQSGHGEPWCLGVTGPVREPTTMYVIRRFLKTALTLLQHRRLVPKEEHARRMDICRGCPAASINGLGCHGCISELRDVEDQVGKKMPDGDVIICEKCKCVSWAKSWIPNDTLDQAEGADRPDYAPGCWRDGH